jgi:threonine dehydrogenase-like Zn-dependent dehydrogenase
MMASLSKKGTKVTWGTAQGETEGTVEKTVTKITKIKGHTAKATKAEPQLVVKSSKSGKIAIHKPDQLKKA